MTTARKPEPGSPWARHCPDAAPRDWISNGALPTGFTRPANPDEAALILGRISEAEFLRRTGKQAPSPVSSTSTPARTPPKRKGRDPGKPKPSAVMLKLAGWNKFYDGLRRQEPRLHPLAVAVWGWLWRCAKDGRARASERRLSERIGVERKTIRRQLRILTDAGFLAVLRRGKRNHTPTIYRVRPVPKKPKELIVPEASPTV